MNGLIIIDKPEGLTSHDVVSRLRRILKTKRIGHTGTLDPFATGVLVMLVGKATRLARFLDKDEKEYEAVVQLGWETDTGDRTGIRRNTGMEGRRDAVRLDEIERVLSKFRGEIEQTPPMYSAKKIEGKKLYELARQGIEVERRSVKVTISKLDLISGACGSLHEAMAKQQCRSPHEVRPKGSTEPEIEPKASITLRVACSAGTYVRTLAEDIGRELRTGAHLNELRRTRAGRFDLSEAVTLEELQQTQDPASVLLPMTEAVAHLPELILNDARIEKTRSGLSSHFETELNDNSPVQMLSESGELVAVGFYSGSEKAVQPKVVLI